MSEQIDWSKAPADATHHCAETDTEHECWLKPGHVVRVSRGTSEWVSTLYVEEFIASLKSTPRPSTTSWSGEGLPPVGVVCEVAPDNSLWGFSTLEIRKCLVIAYHDDFVWLDTFVPGIPVATRVDKVTFRPIRTPEQIAKDERDTAVDEMHKLYMEGAKHGGGLYALYDAGFRKP